MKWHKVSRATAICAMTDDGRVFSKLRIGINDSMAFLLFMEELEDALRTHLFGSGRDSYDEFERYKRSLVFIMDNASIHNSSDIRDYFHNRNFMCITNPQATPEYNPIESMFRNIKNRIYRIPHPEL